LVTNLKHSAQYLAYVSLYACVWCKISGCSPGKPTREFIHSYLLVPKPNYLYEFIEALSSEEKANLAASVDLKGKERALFDLYLSGEGRVPSKAAIASELGMSPSHIDKTSSVVLKKSYDVLASDSRDLWLLLRQKKLIRHFYHELTLEERQLSTSGGTEELAAFYFNAFEALHTMSFQDYDPQEAARFMHCYFELKPQASAAEHIMIEGRLIRQRITNAMARGGGTLSTLHEIEHDLARLEAMIDRSVPSQPVCQLYLAFAQYDKVIVNGNTERQRHHLRMTLAIMEKEHDAYTDEDRQLVHCKIGDTYYQESELEQAYALYKEIIPQWPQVFKTQFFYTSTFAQLSILCNDFLQTDRIIEEFYGPYLAQGAEGGLPAVSAAIQIAKRQLLTANYEEAYRHIQLGYGANDKGLLVPFDIELRKLETIYFALIGNAAFADDLIDKNLKFLQSKGLSVKTSPNAIFFKLIRAILAESVSGKKLTEGQVKQLQEQGQGFAAIGGRLLDYLRTK